MKPSIAERIEIEKEVARLHPIPLSQFRKDATLSAASNAERQFSCFLTADGAPWLDYLIEQLETLGRYRYSKTALRNVIDEAITVYHATLIDLKAHPEAAE